MHRITYKLVALALGGLLIASCAILSGVSTEATVIVRGSSECWYGMVGKATRQGCGYGRFEITDERGLFEVELQKMSESTNEIIVEVLIDDKVVDSASTTAAFGVVKLRVEG